MIYNNSFRLKSHWTITNVWTLCFVAVIILSTVAGCGNDDSAPAFTPDFEYNFVNDNLVRFKNTTFGEYYSVNWDFGNGRTEETTDKNKTFDVSYAEAGDYNVTLKALDFVGNIKSAEKTISIATTSFSVSFSAEISSDDNNIVQLTNLSQGEFDSFKWVFRNKEVANEVTYDAYFPFAGNHVIELIVVKDGITYTDQKNITIITDDADYVDNLTLIWSEEFDGTALNTDAWTYETGASGWGNNELQNYTSGSNADVANGLLTITAKKINDNTAVGSYSSSRIISRNKQEFQYGRIEIRAKLPSGRGIWPAIWMLGGNFTTTGWPACGEIDIMEYVGYQPNTVHATIHTSAGFGSSGNGSSTTLITCEEEFHNYGIVWTPNKIDFYIDTPDNMTHSYAPSNKSNENWPFDQTAFFILNIAVGGNWGGAQGIDNSIFPQTMEVDYIRVYQETN